jgi:hypothetical protein
MRRNVMGLAVSKEERATKVSTVGIYATIGSGTSDLSPEANLGLGKAQQMSSSGKTKRGQSQAGGRKAGEAESLLQMDELQIT